jgi:hypothetical protein
MRYQNGVLEKIAFRLYLFQLSFFVLPIHKCLERGVCELIKDFQFLLFLLDFYKVIEVF